MTKTPIFKATMSFDQALAAVECAKEFQMRRVENGLFEVEVFAYYGEGEQE